MISNVRPDDPCPCSSGLRYAECHQEIDEAAPDRVLDVARRQYARRWKGNASYYEAQGVYRQLAAHLLSNEKVTRAVDIGCGRGEGLVALRDVMTWPGSRLVGIDENPDCLAAAAERLEIDKPAERLGRVGGVGREYDLKVVGGRLPPIAPIMVVQSDLLRPDPELDALIAAEGSYDAVTLWFTGIHAAREHDTEIKRQDLRGDRTLRMATDLAALEYAEAVVRPGGLFHVAIRGGTNDLPAFRVEVEGEMQALSEHGPVSLTDVSMWPYEEPTSGERIGVGAVDVSIQKAQTFVVSAIFRVVAGT